MASKLAERVEKNPKHIVPCLAYTTQSKIQDQIPPAMKRFVLLKEGDCSIPSWSRFEPHHFVTQTIINNCIVHHGDFVQSKNIKNVIKMCLQNNFKKVYLHYKIEMLINKYEL